MKLLWAILILIWVWIISLSLFYIANKAQADEVVEQYNFSTQTWDEYLVSPDMGMYYDFQEGTWVNIITGNGDIIIPMRNADEDDNGYNND